MPLLGRNRRHARNVKRSLLIALCAHERQLEIAREQPLGLGENFFRLAPRPQLQVALDLAEQASRCSLAARLAADYASALTPWG